MATPNAKTLRAVIVDRNNVYRTGLRLMLESAGVEILNETEYVDSLPGDASDPRECDILLLRLPRGNSVVQVLETAREAFPDSKVVVIAESDLDPTEMFRAIQGGADAVLLAELTPDVFLQSLRLVQLGEKVLPTRLAAALLGRDTQAPVPHDARARGLSAREMEILRLLVDGYSNKQIALQLDITEATVKVHVKAVLRKIQVSNRTQAAVWALNHGLKERAAYEALPSGSPA